MKYKYNIVRIISAGVIESEEGEGGCYEFVKMPVGLMNSGATFTRMMRKLLQDVKNVQHYIDDCLVYTKTWEEHVQTLHRFLQRVREENVTVRPSKCEIGYSHMEFVGHEIKEGEIGLQNNNVSKIQEAPRPKTKTQVRSFFGFDRLLQKFYP